MTELQKRVISAVVLIPIVLGIIYIGGWVFNTFVIFLAGLMLYEWFTLTKGGGIFWKIGGVVYIGVACSTFMIVRNASQIICEFPSGRCEDALFFLFTVFILTIVWTTDIGAYFIGRKFGGKKLAPKISPNKTWSGFWGGIISSITLSFLYLIMIIDVKLSGLEIGYVAIWGVAISLISIISQLGDLFESWVKRKFGVKDSGNLIPGHGGILDRVDGLLAVLFVLGIIFGVGQLF